MMLVTACFPVKKLENESTSLPPHSTTHRLPSWQHAKVLLAPRSTSCSLPHQQATYAPAHATTTTTQMWALVATLLTYWRAFFYFWRSDGDFEGCPFLKREQDLPAKVHVYGLWLDLYLWDRPHYRAPTYRHDLLANLRNVAVPGTGLPLSFFCVAKPLAYLFFVFLYPVVALLGAVNVARTAPRAQGKYAALAAAFREHLLTPEDWFNFLIWMKCLTEKRI